MNTYYTCQQVIDLHTSVKAFGWNPAKIGVFYNCLLLDGKYFGKRSRVAVTESSFKNLVAYAYQSLEVIDMEPVYLSYDEIIEEFPQADRLRWSPTVIGILYHSSLLQGKKSNKESRYLITKQSALRLIEYTLQRFKYHYA
ncbi:MAG: hypothetical protein HYZ14_15380 [Bacteroidetes bacterium]|nr:hypothetical protein [Bacteroidota bacterium]